MLSNPPAHPPIPRSSTASKRSRANSVDVRLSMIAEDGVQPPPPPKTHNRPFSRRWNIGDPPRHSFENSPPKYSPWVATGPKGEKLWEVRNNKYIASRGGFIRICLISIVVVAVLVALIVGLVVGLNKKKRTNAGAHETLPFNSSSPSSPSNTGPFPAGSYTFTTYLDTVATNCTSVSADWQCPPYHTYSESPSLALATYQWIIVDSGSQSIPNFTVSSSNNPFNIEFANASLTLVDQNSSSERYTFSAHFNKVVVPSPGIYCYFNKTTISGNLYTKRAKSGPPKSSGSSTTSAAQPTATSAASNSFEEWKYAVQTTQSIGGGSMVPECFHMNNGVRGERASDGIEAQAPQDMCSCVYQNYGL